MKKYIFIGIAAVAFIFLLVREWTKPSYQTELENGFDGLLANLKKAERNLSSPVAMAPPLEERRLKEGYKYLLGHLVRITGSEFNNNPETPRIERAITFLSKWTGDNADNAYLQAPIDGNFAYKVTGMVPYYRGNNAKTLRDIPQAPGLVLFQTGTNMVGDTGSLKEFKTCRNQTLGFIDNHSLQIEPDGSFEILLSPEKPDNYEGNWLATKANLPCKSDNDEEKTKERVAKFLVIRETFFNWTREHPLDLDIVRIGFEGIPPSHVSTAERAEQMRALGEKTANQIEFWNWLMQIGLEAWGDRDFDGEARLPVNDVNPPEPPFVAGGMAGAKLLYASGMFALEKDEALILEIENPAKPDYIGFHLGDAWMQSTDQANYVSSRNHTQMEAADNNSIYLVVAHKDPGILNWVDTTGLINGQMVFRFWYADEPSADKFPQINARKVQYDNIRGELASKNPTMVTQSQRRLEVAERQKHIRMRYREY